MNRNAKRITGYSVKDRYKDYIKTTTRPFDGNGSAFKAAIYELRKDGFSINYCKEKCHYVNNGKAA